MKYLLLTLMVLLTDLSHAQQFDVVTALAFQSELNSQYADSLKSPLTKEDLKSFNSLDFFSVDLKYSIVAKFVKAKKEKPFEMKTSTERRPLYIKYGTLFFTIDGKSFQLNAYQDIALSKKPGFGDYLFLPFSDLTSGKESYIGGRYIDVKVPKGNEIEIDFNKAYNPYCAYNHIYSCPIVPLENDLDIEIKAGVKKFHD